MEKSDENSSTSQSSDNDSSSRDDDIPRNEKLDSPCAKTPCAPSWKVTPQKCINPFRMDLEDLRNSHLSPNVFATNPENTDQRDKSFRWSIDQLADLKPVNIDESSNQNVHDDYVSEELQTAIDEFFSKNQVAPSPWLSTTRTESLAQKSNHQVTFSPNLASTAYYDRYEEMLESSEKPKLCRSTQHAYTQTVLTVPPNVDLEEILSQFHTFTEDQQKNVHPNPELYPSEDSNSTFNNSSLRRKLFDFIDERCEKEERFMFNPNKIVYQNSPSVSPLTVKTPSCQSKGSGLRGSSSPITPSYERRTSGEFSTENMVSPEMSPIQKTFFKTPSTGSKGSENSFQSHVTPKRKPAHKFPNVLRRNFKDLINVSGIEVADESVSNSSSSNMSVSFSHSSIGDNVTNEVTKFQDQNESAIIQNCFDICSTRIHSDSAADLMEYSEASNLPDQDTGYQSNTQAYSVNSNVSTLKSNVHNKPKTMEKQSSDELELRINDDCFRTPPSTPIKK